MHLDITTPAILFPAISLLMLAYTNRFLALAQLIRSLYEDYKQHPSEVILKQIRHLRYRVFLIRVMQAFGAASLIVCVFSIGALLLDLQMVGLVLFVGSLLFFLGSLISSFIEILYSTRALGILLSTMEEAYMEL